MHIRRLLYPESELHLTQTRSLVFVFPVMNGFTFRDSYSRGFCSEVLVARLAGSPSKFSEVLPNAEFIEIEKGGKWAPERH